MSAFKCVLCTEMSVSLYVSWVMQSFKVPSKYYFYFDLRMRKVGFRLSDSPTVVRQQSWSLNAGFHTVTLVLRPCVAHAFPFLESWSQMGL